MKDLDPSGLQRISTDQIFEILRQTASKGNIPGSTKGIHPAGSQYLKDNQEQIQEEKESEYSLDSSSSGGQKKKLIKGVDIGEKGDTESILNDIEPDFASDQKKFMKMNEHIIGALESVNRLSRIESGFLS